MAQYLLRRSRTTTNVKSTAKGHVPEWLRWPKTLQIYKTILFIRGELIMQPCEHYIKNDFWYIDWLVLCGFMSYRHYFRHITAATIIKQCFWFLKIYLIFRNQKIVYWYNKFHFLASKNYFSGIKRFLKLKKNVAFWCQKFDNLMSKFLFVEIRKSKNYIIKI